VGFDVCVWREDADSIRFGEKSLDIIYQNQIIRDYLKSNRRLGIAGTKGQGKTFLLKAKRAMVQGDNSSTPIVCFPKDEMVDTLDSSISITGVASSEFTINKSLTNCLKDFGLWVQIWKLSIAITIIGSSEFAHLYNEKDFATLNKNSRNLLGIKNSKSRPSIIFYQILDLNFKEFSLVIKDTIKFMQLLDRISNAVYIFIDKIDQAFSGEIIKIVQRGKGIYSKNASFWQYAQYALASASYEIFSNVNSHIKVFYTIRHEALLDAQNLVMTSRNIEGYISELVYTQDDIFEMFKLYVSQEDDENLFSPIDKNRNPEKAFFGFERIKHTYVTDTEERIFSYLYRHSLRRPYDVMKICRELYLKNPKHLTVTIVRHTINDISNKVLKSYLSEVSPFISCTPNEIERLLGCLNTNFFDIQYIQYICKRYNKFFAKMDECWQNCETCKNAHPFSTLYNIGLLGCLKNSSAHPVYTQRFLPIGESKLKIEEYDLPVSPLYCLHPCLCDVSRNHRNYIHHSFFTTNTSIAGEGIEISDVKIDNIKAYLPICMEKLDQEKVFVSSTVYDLEEERKTIKRALFKAGYYPIMSESGEFEYGPNTVHSHDHCIDELLKCRHIVFIIGEQYGGPYAGNKYKNIKEKIVTESHGEIKDPSISLMEFVAAQQSNISYHIFVKNEVLNQHRMRNKPDVTYTCDPNIFKIINYINHLQKDGVKAGNWYIPYKSIQDLRRRLNSLNFN